MACLASLFRVPPSKPSIHRGFDGQRQVGIAAVVEIVTAARRVVVYVDGVGLIPIRRPSLRHWIENREPDAVVVELRIAADIVQRQIIDAEQMPWTEVGAELRFRDAVSAVAAAFPPIAVLALPVSRTILREDIPLIGARYAARLLQVLRTWSCTASRIPLRLPVRTTALPVLLLRSRPPVLLVTVRALVFRTALPFLPALLVLTALLLLLSALLWLRLR